MYFLQESTVDSFILCKQLPYFGSYNATLFEAKVGLVKMGVLYKGSGRRPVFKRKQGTLYV